MSYHHLTIHARQAMSEAQSLAIRRGHPQIEVEHFLLAMLKQNDPLARKALARSRIPVEKLTRQLESHLEKTPAGHGPGLGETHLSPLLSTILDNALKEAEKHHSQYVGIGHLLLVMLDEAAVASQMLRNYGVTRQGLMDALRAVGSYNAVSSVPTCRAETLMRFGSDLTQLAAQGKVDPLIGRDNEIRRVIQILSRRTKNNPVLIGEPGVGKTAIVEGVALRVARGDVPNGLKKKRVVALDLGALVAGTKYRGMFEKRFKKVLEEVEDSRGHIILFIDELHNLIGAGSGRGVPMDAANLLKPLLARGVLHCIGATTFDEYRRYVEKDAALERRFQPVQVDEPSVELTVSILRGLKEGYERHHGVRIKDEALVAAATLSDRYIADRFLPDKAIDLIDEAAALLRTEIESVPTELDEVERRQMQLEIEYHALKKERDTVSQAKCKRLEKELGEQRTHAGWMRIRWQQESEAMARVKDLRAKIKAAEAAIDRAQRVYDLNKAAEIRYQQLENLHRLAKQAEADVSKSTSRLLKEEVGEEDIARVVSRWSGIPVNKLMEGEVRKLLNLEAYLNRRVVGQSEAIRTVASSVMRARAGIKDPGRPIGTFLFLGPSGVGKTELARELAEVLFNDEKGLIRFDMSEYMEKQAVARLIGAAPGYVGYEEGGQLTEAIRRKPYAVVLFDELEKAHRDVFHLFLQVMDEGRLTDSHGRTVDFRNTVLIMTSNIGGAEILETTTKNIGFKARNDSQDENHRNIKRRVLEELKRHCQPEFINRVDATVVFNGLGKEHLADIVDIQVERLAERLEKRGIRLEVTAPAKQWLVETGYDPNYGARTLRRVIETELEPTIATKLIKGEIGGEIMLRVDARDGELHFEEEKLPVVKAG
jgi:ATP-dependent Clp protease ATP-binding subunit ClpB